MQIPMISFIPGPAISPESRRLGERTRQGIEIWSISILPGLEDLSGQSGHNLALANSHSHIGPGNADLCRISGADDRICRWGLPGALLYGLYIAVCDIDGGADLSG